MNTVLAERVLPTAQTIQMVQGDLTSETTDAIVNAANENLQHGAGVAGAIVRGGGRTIQDESDAWIRMNGRVAHAHPAWTSGGRLPARYVIHAVGPVWGAGDEDSKLSSAIRGSLQVAEELKLASVSFPAISTGIFGFPKEAAATIFFRSIEAYFRDRPDSSIKQVRVVLFDPSTIDAFMKVWAA